MATASQEEKSANSNGTATEYGPQLWAAANILRGSMDAAEYKHVVLPLIFLKYISDSFEDVRQELELRADDGYDPEEPDSSGLLMVTWATLSAGQMNGVERYLADTLAPAVGELARTVGPYDNAAVPRPRPAPNARVGRAPSWEPPHPTLARRPAARLTCTCPPAWTCSPAPCRQRK